MASMKLSFRKNGKILVRQKKRKKVLAFFSDFFAFSNHFQVLKKKKNLFCLIRSRDKVVRKILIEKMSVPISFS